MRDYTRYATGILFIVGALVLIIVGFNIIRSMFTDDEAPKTQQQKSVNLIDAGKSGKSVRYTISGAILGEEQHREIRITIDPNTRRADIIQGYNGQVIKTSQVSNNKAAYDAFIAALNGAGFTSQINPQGRGTESQTCTLGQRYSYEVAPGTSDAFRTWSNSCARKEGTFQGNRDQVQRLFQGQIPDYSAFAGNVSLN